MKYAYVFHEKQVYRCGWSSGGGGSGEKQRQEDDRADPSLRALWSQGRTFTLTEVEAMEGSRKRRDLTWLRRSQISV